VTTGADKWLHVHHHVTAHACADELRRDAFRVLCAKPEAPEQDVVRVICLGPGIGAATLCNTLAAMAPGSVCVGAST